MISKGVMCRWNIRLPDAIQRLALVPEAPVLALVKTVAIDLVPNAGQGFHPGAGGGISAA